MRLSQRRLLQLSAFLAAWTVVIVFRLMHVQLVRHDHYVERAQKQQESTLALKPVRGEMDAGFTRQHLHRTGDRRHAAADHARGGRGRDRRHAGRAAHREAHRRRRGENGL